MNNLGDTILLAIFYLAKIILLGSFIIAGFL